MGAGRITETVLINGSAPSSTSLANSSACTRNLRKSHLGGVIFGCKSATVKECLFKQLFGLPAQHFVYVKNIDPGLPLFLFNYSNRNLQGIFEAASPGQMNINPYGWTKDGSERTPYPAQVQIRIRLQCQPMSEDKFRPVIADNYYNQTHFWFELDHAQTNKLISLFSSFVIAPGSYIPRNTAKWRNTFRDLPSSDIINDGDKPFPEAPSTNSDQSSIKSVSSDAALCIDGDSQPLPSWNHTEPLGKHEEDLIYMKLKELALNRAHSESSLTRNVEDNSEANEMPLGDISFLEKPEPQKNDNTVSSALATEVPTIIAQLMEEIRELKAFKEEQIHKMGCLEQQLVKAEFEIQQLKEHRMVLQPTSNASIAPAEKIVTESFTELELHLNESIFLIGGYDGLSWLSTLEMYSPTRGKTKSLEPMISVRSYASVAKLNGEIYVLGGGNGSLWYDTVESYNIDGNRWTSRPSLNERRGSLAGLTLNERIFVIGGGNDLECFSEVEMFDIDIGRWIPTQSMLQKRFALAGAELNGVLYATGGYDGNEYLKTAERFDPREHFWTKIEDMNSRRGCHSLAVLNEKIYAVGGFDGNSMVPSVEMYDPRVGTWTAVEPMNQPRGYATAAVLKEAIYVIGGVKVDDSIVDTVGVYEESKGWREINANAVGKRCFLSAITV